MGHHEKIGASRWAEWFWFLRTDECADKGCREVAAVPSPPAQVNDELQNGEGGGK